MEPFNSPIAPRQSLAEALKSGVSRKTAAGIPIEHIVSDYVVSDKIMDATIRIKFALIRKTTEQ